MYTQKRIDDMEAVFRGSFRRARAELGVRSFGMQVLDFPAHAHRYPEHDHADTGQEEVFVVLSGSGAIEIDGERVELDPSVMVRVAPEAKRKLVTDDSPMRVLALGGVPGKAYEPPSVTELGEPDPLAQAQR